MLCGKGTGGRLRREIESLVANLMEMMKGLVVTREVAKEDY